MHLYSPLSHTVSLSLIFFLYVNILVSLKNKYFKVMFSGLQWEHCTFLPQYLSFDLLQQGAV